MRSFSMKFIALLFITNAMVFSQETDIQKITAGIERRIQFDSMKLLDILKKQQLSADAKKIINGKILELKSSIGKDETFINPKTFRAIVPVNKTHEQLFKLFAQVLQQKGHQGLEVWHKYRYAPLSVFEFPDRKPSCLSIETMMNEHRAEVFNMTNCTDDKVEVRFRIENLPNGMNPPYLKPYQVEFVDTRKGEVIASALVELKEDKGWYTTNIPSGMTRQIWISSFPREIQAGKYNGSIRIVSSSENKEVPISLSIAPIRMPDMLDISCGMWDYSHTDTPSSGLTDQTRPLAINDMKTHYVNIPWAVSQAIPKVKPEDFDAEGNLIRKIDFTAFDTWVKDWPKAKLFMIFASAKPRFAGIEQNTPQFATAIKQWAGAWAKHNREIGLKARQVGILFVDEPRSLEDVQISMDWIIPFKKGSKNEMVVFVDPVLGNLDKTEIPVYENLFQLCDIICFNTKNYMKLKGDYKKAVERVLGIDDKELWFYMCSGPVRNFDPAYYRLQPWYAFFKGATNSSFWSYGDTRRESNWNEYVGQVSNFSPVYIDTESITNSKHWEALREGLQDYQYLKMFMQDVNNENKQNIKVLVENVIKGYVDSKVGRKEWQDGDLCEFADSARLRILEFYK